MASASNQMRFERCNPTSERYKDQYVASSIDAMISALREGTRAEAGIQKITQRLVPLVHGSDGQPLSAPMICTTLFPTESMNTLWNDTAMVNYIRSIPRAKIIIQWVRNWIWKHGVMQQASVPGQFRLMHRGNGSIELQSSINVVTGDPLRMIAVCWVEHLGVMDLTGFTQTVEMIIDSQRAHVIRYHILKEMKSKIMKVRQDLAKSLSIKQPIK